jgi:carbon monoxide dehydrogenase subunit G
MVYSMIAEPKARVSEFVKNFETLAFCITKNMQ